MLNLTLTFPSARHLYTATSDGETMTCVTCELQVQPSSSLKTFSRITTRIFARIIGSLQTSRGEFCQRSSVLPNWSFSHYVHSCLGQVSRLWSVFWGERWWWWIDDDNDDDAFKLACKLACRESLMSFWGKPPTTQSSSTSRTTLCSMKSTRHLLHWWSM